MILLVPFFAAGLAMASPVAIAPLPPDDNALVLQLGDKTKRDDARRMLVAHGAAAVPALIAHAHDDNGELRWEVANILGAVGDERAAPALADLTLHDGNPHIRWRSLWALSRVATKDAATALLRKGLADENADTKWNAAIGLSFFGSPEAIDLIHANVLNPDPFRRWEAINALGRVHNEKSVAALKPALQSPSVRDRNEAVLSLGNIGGDEARALLIDALSDSASDVRWRAAMALGRAGDASVVASLRLLASGDPDEMVREQAAKAADKLTKR